MGLFSWDCLCCGHSVLHTANWPRGWQEQMVVSMDHGPWVVGNYDGYGCVDGEEVLRDLYAKDPEETSGYKQVRFPIVMHEACWESAGKPAPEGLPYSRSAYDQGHRGSHDVEEPKAGDFLDREKWDRPPGAPWPEYARPCACDADQDEDEDGD